MHLVLFIGGLVLCVSVALDAFHTIVLPRRPTARFRVTRLFYKATRKPYFALADRLRSQRMKVQLYSLYGPGSVIGLLILWAAVVVLGYSTMFLALNTPFSDALRSQLTPGVSWSRWNTDLYVSATTFFTLGLGDVTPKTQTARMLVVSEVAMGFGLIAIVIGYLPVIYQAFSRREVPVAMLDIRGGSPPTGAGLVRRNVHEGDPNELVALLLEWEHWAAEVLESHLSFPILCYYRSQHDNQSWLTGMVAVMDACAIVLAAQARPETAALRRQAQRTMATTRHILIDVSRIFLLHLPLTYTADANLGRRFASQASLREALSGTAFLSENDKVSYVKVNTISNWYEPIATALSRYLRMPLPSWDPAESNGLRDGAVAETFDMENVQDPPNIGEF